MAKKLVERGHEVTIVCGSCSSCETGLTSQFLNGRRSGLVDDIFVIEFELDYSNSQTFIQRSILFTKFAFRSIKLSLTLKFDVVFATTTPLTAALPGIVARWFRKKHFIFEVRDLWPELPKAMGVIKNPIILTILSALEWLAYKSAHGHIGLSPGIVSGIERHLPKTKKPVNIPNGCDLNIFSKPITPWQPEGLNGDDFVAVFTGAHGQANGLDKVLDVAKELKIQKIHGIKIVLIGQGKLKASLQYRAKEELLNNVLFLEPVNKIQIARLMKRADVGLQVLADVPAFYYGTSPNKFFDYIAAGLPVINNYPGWIAELIEEYQCGYAVSAGNSTAFIAALLKLKDNEISRATMSANALNLAKSKFNRELLATKFVDYIEQSYLQRHD